ncbi:SLC13 family permease [Desulfovibrio ferrophilus]|uniref:Putative sodium-dependent transporter n=1 Tax=Desulfovibrio ferrophilus TaxID=241368 RepID=A0A2Z6B2S8_9BACT|nr:SLC13 family permease [Desulfovibrio ferrophilus]BBD09802.1 putative sodium-dependent transporter [Desulfovibrio ferrophilus]
MELPQLTSDMIMVLCLVGITVFLFLTEWLRVDVVAILIMVALPLLGLIEGRDAFDGLSSNAVISIIAVIIMGRGLDHTGVISMLMKPLMRMAGKSKSRILVLLAGTVAVISSFMQNVGAAALFLPAIRRLSRHSGIPIAQLLMPIGFSAILGGTITLVGSSPLIMLNDLMRPYDLPPFNLFSVVPVGLALVASGILYFIIAGRFVLPRQPTDASAQSDDQDLMIFYPELGSLHEFQAPRDLSEDLHIYNLCESFNIHTVGLAMRGGRDMMTPPDRDMRIQPGAILAAFGTDEQMQNLRKTHGFIIRRELKLFADSMSDDVSGVVEALIPQHSDFIGKSIADIRFRHNHLMTPLSHTRGNDTITTGFWNKTLLAGDSILMHGSWESFHRMRPRRDILFAQSLDHEVLHPELAVRALGAFALSTLLIIFTDLTLSVCLMTGALGMILSRVLTIDEAYRGVDWRTVFLLGGLIPLGSAMQSTGTAAWLASNLMAMVGTPSPTVFIFMVGLLSTIFTLVVSNVGAVVLLVPLVVGMSAQVGADPRMAAMVVALAASNSFVLPTHQVNALYMGPGNYSSRDFLKAGTPLTLIFLIVMTAMVSLFY